MVGGPDGWSLALIKGMKHIIVLYFYERKTFSIESENGYVAQVYKSGPNSNSCQLLKIVLSYHISKILEKVVRKYIIKYMDKNYLWDNRQNVSRKGCSTLSQLLQHQDNILRVMEQ